jgi:hypothetical protein
VRHDDGRMILTLIESFWEVDYRRDGDVLAISAFEINCFDGFDLLK